MIDFKEKFVSIAAHLDEIEEQLADPETIKDQKLYTKLSRSHSELSEAVAAYRRFESVEDRLAQAKEMRADPDPEIKEMAEEEIAEATGELKKAERDLHVLLLPGDPRDARNTIMEIRGGAGGDEAALFARDLFEMYQRLAEKHDWKVEVLSGHRNDYGGIKEIAFLVKGDKVYSRLKYESGTHRVQRVPATETQGRIHTSTVTVAVMPEAEEFDIEIRPDDIKVDTYRSSGAGGQHVNKTDSAVRMTHIPTGTVVACQDERSQIKNRASAMKMLRAKLFQFEEDKRQAEVAAERKQQVGTGARSERIRTYNFPQTRLTDHRIGLTIHSLDAVMMGELDGVIDALAADAQAKALASL